MIDVMRSATPRKKNMVSAFVTFSEPDVEMPTRDAPAKDRVIPNAIAIMASPPSG
jgi:hypothetical protein